MNETPAAGAGMSAAAGTPATPVAPQPQPGGTGGSPGAPPAGLCTKVCVNTAIFVIDSPMSADQLSEGQLRACHNGDQECLTGSMPPRGSASNAVSFGQPEVWNGPTVASFDDWKSIDFRWQSIQSMNLRDGDRFSLTWVKEDEQLLLFEQVVAFEVVPDCTGSCKYARYDLRGVGSPQGGAANSGR